MPWYPYCVSGMICVKEPDDGLNMLGGLFATFADNCLVTVKRIECGDEVEVKK